MIILPIDELMWPGLEKMKFSSLEKNEIYFGKYFFPINWQSRQEVTLVLSWPLFWNSYITTPHIEKIV